MLTTTRIHRICTLAISAFLTLPAAALAETVNFQTPGTVTWTVPANVTSASFEVVGAAGGRDGAKGSACTPGAGFSQVDTVPVNPGEAFTISVGGKGGDGAANRGGSGGLPDGGAGGTVASGGAGGGGGGGSTKVESVDRQSYVIDVAGGGGGCGGFASSAGGNGGGVFSSGAPGSGDGTPGENVAGGGGRGVGDPGAGGANAPADGTAGNDGLPAAGGAGAGSDLFLAGGGGGGGGRSGGGGGGAAASNDGSGGGGGVGGSIEGSTRKNHTHIGPTPSTGDGWVTITFTPVPAPVVSTGPASAVTDAAATLAGAVNPEGIVTHYHFEYGTTTSYGQATGDISSASTNSQSLSESLSGLAPGTLYHYRVVATNASGTTNGPDQTFRTSGPPSVVTGAASGVAATAATLGGTVNPNGHATSYHFEIGTTTAYGQQTPEASLGAGLVDQQVTATPTGLVPGTVYHYRLVAVNASGTTDGADHTVTTVASSRTVSTGNVHVRPALAVVGHPSVGRGSVRVTLACRFAPCRASLVLTASVGRHARQTIGSSALRMRAGARTTITVSLGAAGRRLLAGRGRLAARLVVALLDGSGRAHAVANLPVALR